MSPRDAWIKRGWINQNIPPQTIPGTPQQTIAQPNLVVQTPSNQGFIMPLPDTYFIVPPVGQSATITVAFGGYVGNIGDITNITLEFGNGNPNLPIGSFLITAFSGASITVQTISSAQAGNIEFDVFGMIFLVQSLGPGTPQPPLIIPPGPSTIIPCQPYYQNGILFTPANGTPYDIMVIGGHVLKVDPDFGSGVIDLSEVWNLYLPVTPKCYFCQAETFLIIQAGDYNAASGTGTLPLFWDGSTLYRSNGQTGVSIVGTPTPDVFSLTLGPGWTPADTVGDFSTATFTAPYPGNLYDNVTLVTGATALGNYRVLGISGNSVTFLTLYQSGSIAPVAAAAPIEATLNYPVLPSGTPDSAQNVTIGNGSWTVPLTIGATVMLNLTSLYFGSVGDTIELYNDTQSEDYGQFQVVSFNAEFQIVLQYTKASASDYTGKLVFGTMYAFVQSARTLTDTFTPSGDAGKGSSFMVEPQGGTTTVYLPAFDGTFSVKLYDNVLATLTGSGDQLGIFRVSAAGQYYNGDHSFPFITLESLVPNPTYQGQSFSTKISLQVIIPPAPTGYLVVNDGSWAVPPVGQSVNLQMLWPDQLGPAYPGNIGDTVTLANGAIVVGVFTVKNFDQNGNITLTTTAATPASNIGQMYTGFGTLTMTISQLPSTIGTLISQIPAATEMVYYQGIVWYARGNVSSGGDVVGGASGTNAPSYSNSVLCVTENPLALGGDGFRLPIPGDITGMAWPAQINAALGQGLLYISTINGVCSLQVPSNRQAWISMNSNNLPQINVVTGSKRDQPGYGPVSGTSIVSINGDLYFQSSQPAIWSLIQAQRYFQQWGNIDLSDNEERLWNFVDTSIMQWISGIYFNKRLLMTSLPQVTVNGTIHKAIVPMDMTPIDTFEELTPPNWEGMHEGLQIFQLLTSGEFNGGQRAFAVALSETNPNEIDLWENVPTAYFDNAGNGNIPIQWQVETPAFTWGKETDLKELVGGSLWMDSIVGEIAMRVEWRPDFASCWTLWDEWTECFAENSLNAPCVKNPTPYPVNLPPGYKPSIDLPRPPQVMQTETGRPAAQGFQFQFRITATGQCRIRGLAFHCQFVEKNIYQNLVRSIKGLVNKLFR